MASQQKIALPETERPTPLKVGSRVQLDIPANLAYGDNPGNGAPGGTLQFIVDLLSAS